jgi:hypothetical protein
MYGLDCITPIPSLYEPLDVSWHQKMKGILALTILMW